MIKKLNKKYFILLLALLSFNTLKAQHDSDSLKNILLVWNLEDNFKKSSLLLQDTSIDAFHKTSKEEKWSILTSNLGNFGSAGISDIFIKRDDEFNREFIFNSPYLNYIKNSQNIKYFNTRKPFTSVMHTTSTKIKNLQTINFIHTQNINPNFNIAAIFDFMTSYGQTAYQETKVNSTGISLNYNKDRYSIFASYVFSKINNQNSGGFIINEDDVTNFPPPFMEDANNLLNNQEVSATQAYSFGAFKNVSYGDTIIKVLEPKVSLSHNINLYQKYRLYTDSEIPRNDEDNDGSIVYNKFFYSETETSDSTSIMGVSNKVRFGSEQVFEDKNKFGFSIILESDLKEYYIFNDYIILENNHVYFENNINAEIFSNKFLNSELNLFAKYYYSGYRKNDFRSEININKKGSTLKSSAFFNLNLQYSNYKPNFFTQNYYSNHYRWDSELNNIQKYKTSISINLPKYKLNTSFHTSAVYNYTFLDPAKGSSLQYDSMIVILTANIKKDFILNKFKISNNIYWQNSSNEDKISLPKLALYHSSSYKFQYRDALLGYLGYEVNYSTKYKALNFSPSIGLFYYEGILSPIIGNYPFVGLFMNIKIKKNVLMSFKFQHVNSKLMNTKYPFQINHYPVYGRLFKFSIKWTFKN